MLINAKVEFIDAKESYPAPSNIIQRFYFLFFQPNEDAKNKTENQRVSKIFNTFKVHYVAADRIGPQNFFVKSNLDKFVNVGPRGEYTANVLAKQRNYLVKEQLYLGQDARTLEQQTEEWLNYIFDGAKIVIKIVDDIVLIRYNTEKTAITYKPTNVGFGYSYILPIIVSGLIAKEGEILIVENPEAHLHPRAQSHLTHFLAKVANCGVQVFVESHSEHILNAIRIATLERENKTQVLKNNEVSILYFDKFESEKQVISIPIDRKGGIELWPKGFFDQTNEDFDVLFGI